MSERVTEEGVRERGRQKVREREKRGEGEQKRDG